MSVTKELSKCKRCTPSLKLIRRYNTEGPNAIEPQKMQAKTVVLNQWKLISQLKSYFSKFSNTDMFENALNKEFANFLRKIQPSIYGSTFIRKLDTTITENERDSKQNMPSTLTSVLNGLKDRIVTKEKEVALTGPRWKAAKVQRFITQESISSRTSQLICMLVNAESEESKLGKIDELCTHLKQYPEAKHNAVKEGAIRLLLSIRQTSNSAFLQSALNESLALLGYTDPVPGYGVRILSIDGGGVRGMLVIEMLRKLEELSGKPIHEMFDIICGVSTGAILANLIGVKQKSLDEIEEIYKNISMQIFSQSQLKGTSNLVLNHSFYDTQLWETLLQNELGEECLISTRRNLTCPKLCTVSAVVNQSRLSAYLFRNYSLPCRVQSQYMGCATYKIWEAVRASAAAPTYFEEFKLGSLLHQDGGILINNPTAVAIHEAKLLWPSTPLQCVISFGTGRTAPNPVDLTAKPVPITSSSWKRKIVAVIESATDTEGVHMMLNDLLPEHIYYRFNPYLTEMLDIAEINQVKLEQLRRDAVMYLRRNEEKFQEAAKVLNIPKSLTQKALDWIELQREIQGLATK